MIITKKALPRRTVLRGIGVTLALPLLDAMVPALSAVASTAAKPVQRYGFFYMPNGVAMNHTGVNYWKPKTVGADFEFSPILKPLEPFRNQMTVVSGLHNRSAESLGDGNGDHTRSTGSWLTGTHIKRTEGSDLRAGISVDQVIASQFSKETPLPSLELAILPNSVTGGCDTGYSCAYGTTLAWASPTTPLPTQSSPRLVFEQLFGDGGPASQQLAAAAHEEQHPRLGDRGDGRAAGEAGPVGSLDGLRLPGRPARSRTPHSADRGEERRSRRCRNTSAPASACPSGSTITPS